MTWIGSLRTLRRPRRILVVAIPVAVVAGVLAHVRGVGWFVFDCVVTPTGTQCGGFRGNPILWGPLGWPLAPVGNFAPSLMGFVFAVAWWLSLGALAGLVVDGLARRGKSPVSEVSES